ncbi:hypothetical protein ACFQ1Y_05765 [Virgibacillus alimentarius]|uniref:hypothetical protein n=1 Tax=Virgibacillus alimentarius TaxID=698769 RepID=UPI0029C07F0E|nr:MULTISPECIES: hypothetical protein [Virgibacillus]HLR69121.1 hypothetical protein [Virgibacillus sp.]
MVCLSLTVRELLEDKGLKMQENHLRILKDRWEGLQVLKGDLDTIQVDDADIGLRNIPGGDHIE